MATPQVKLDIKSNIKRFTKGLNKVGKSQIPFTTNETIGNTAFTLRNATIKEMPRHVDRPTNKTLKDVRYQAPKRSKTALPIGYVYFSPLVSTWLKYSIEGGSRPYKKGRVLPTRNVSLNNFGNVRNHRNIISTFRNKKNHFINSTGIFKRDKSGNKALYIFEKRAVSYKKTFPFFDIMNKKSINIFNFFFQKNLQKNIAKTTELINKGVLRI
jgi:hypothetical protein